MLYNFTGIFWMVILCHLCCVLLSVQHAVRISRMMCLHRCQWEDNSRGAAFPTISTGCECRGGTQQCCGIRPSQQRTAAYGWQRFRCGVFQHSSRCSWGSCEYTHHSHCTDCSSLRLADVLVSFCFHNSIRLCIWVESPKILTVSGLGIIRYEPVCCMGYNRWSGCTWRVYWWLNRKGTAVLNSCVKSHTY